MDDSSLPVAYGKTRLVLLVVDPYLVHAYWEISPWRLRDLKKKTARGPVVLRFYPQNGKSFDMEIDLQARNWYVHLWSPEESLYADLAVRMKDGTLIRLARSQVVRLPRARPVTAVEQHFMKVDAEERRAELVPPPPIPHAASGPTVLPIDSAAIVHEKLKEVYASVAWRPAEKNNPMPGEPAQDLTQTAEESFAPGLSSGEPQKK
jgi:hypothetical protein